MSESREGFEQWLIKKYPKRSPKILTQRFKDENGVEFYPTNDVELHWEAWQEQQKKIDALQGRIDAALSILGGMKHNGAYRAIECLKGGES